ncbi:hypothetical protein RUND412_000894 [Rhizina undulata]
MAVGAHVPLRFLRAALKKGIALLKNGIPTAQHTSKILEPIYARIPTQNANLPHALRFKIGKRWYSTSLRGVFRSTEASSRTPIRSAVGRITTTSPFASTLRPKLAGALPRAASGYSLGGSARYFSHGPAAPAQVIQQVSSAMRAFMFNGKDQMDSYRRYNGTRGRVGVRAQLAASLVEEKAPGAYVDFYLSPTFTCLSPLNSKKNTLETPGFLDTLSADFGAMIGNLTTVYSDIKRLRTLGDLPITIAGSAGDIIRVHFHGRDRESVELLCDEVGVRRGIVYEDEKFAFSVLNQAFPIFSWREMMSDSPPISSTYSEDGHEDEFSNEDDTEIRQISGSELGSSGYLGTVPDEEIMLGSLGYSSPSIQASYEGLEGIHRFLAECDEYRATNQNW